MSTPRRQQGFSLVDILIGLALGVMLSLALSRLFVISKQSLRLQDSVARQQDNARVALELLARSIRAADSWAGVAAADIQVPTTLGISGRAGARNCTAAWIADPLDALHGYDGGSTPPLDCLAANDYLANSDMLALKYAGADGSGSAVPSGSASSIWLRLAVGGAGTLFRLADLAAAQTSIVAASGDYGVLHAPYTVIVYALRPCSVQNSSGHCTASADGGQPLPTLVAIQLTSAGNLEEKPLVENIEQLQFEYGIDSDRDHQVDRYQTASGISDWSQVLSVRIGLVARGDVLARQPDTRRYTLPGGYSYQASASDARWPRQRYLRDVTIRKRMRQ